MLLICSILNCLYYTTKLDDIAVGISTMGTLGAQGSDIPGLYNVTNSKVVNAEIAQMTNTLMSFNAKLGMNAASYVGTSGVKLSTLDTSANIIRKMGMVTMYKRTIAIVKEA